MDSAWVVSLFPYLDKRYFITNNDLQADFCIEGKFYAENLKEFEDFMKRKYNMKLFEIYYYCLSNKICLRFVKDGE